MVLLMKLLELGHLQLAAVAAMCVQYKGQIRFNISIVVKALSPLPQYKAAAPGAIAYGPTTKA
jgi:hypothetical protein